MKLLSLATTRYNKIFVLYKLLYIVPAAVTFSPPQLIPFPVYPWLHSHL